MKIQIFGSGCPTCKKLYELTQKAAKELGLEEPIEYVTGAKGIQTIIEMRVMQSPVLAINGKPVLTGDVSDIEIIKNILISKQASNDGDNKPGCSCGGKC